MNQTSGFKKIVVIIFMLVVPFAINSGKAVEKNTKKKV